MNKYPINIVWSEDDGEYLATCASFPGLSAFGETEEEALKEAKKQTKEQEMARTLLTQIRDAITENAAMGVAE